MTDVQVIAWIEKVEELEGNAFAGRDVTDEETVKIGNYYLSGDYLIKNLERIRQEKQKTLLSLAQLEAAAKRILDKLAQKQIVL